MHPWYSPWDETIVVDALQSTGLDPSSFLTRACGALTSEDATYFRDLARILARYHQINGAADRARVPEWCGLCTGCRRRAGGPSFM